MSNPFDPQYADIRNRIAYYAGLYGIPVNIGIWQLWKENKFRSTGCSGAGACGIAQFTAATASRFGVDRNNVESSLNGWGKYMAWLLRQSYIGGNIALALAGYNAGEGRVQQYHGIPPFAETQDYVSYILQNAGSDSAVATYNDTQTMDYGLTDADYSITSIPTAENNDALYWGLGILALFLIL